MSEIKLLSCPFCGGEAGVFNRHTAFWAFCANDECGTETQGKTNKSEAIAAWNRRTALSSAAVAERDEATAYMRNLLLAFVGEHFPDNDGWKPLDDLVGMLTQIDNASTIACEYKARLAEALKVLEPFADIADLIDAETEGLSETNELELHFHDYLMASWPVALFRAARRVREGGKADG